MSEVRKGYMDSARVGAKCVSLSAFGVRQKKERLEVLVDPREVVHRIARDSNPETGTAAVETGEMWARAAIIVPTPAAGSQFIVDPMVVQLLDPVSRSQLNDEDMKLGLVGMMIGVPVLQDNPSMAEGCGVLNHDEVALVLVRAKAMHDPQSESDVRVFYYRFLRSSEGTVTLKAEATWVEVEVVEVPEGTVVPPENLQDQSLVTVATNMKVPEIPSVGSFISVENPRENNKNTMYRVACVEHSTWMPDMLVTLLKHRSVYVYVTKVKVAT